MISDTLSDAIHEIEDQQANHPNAAYYGSVRNEIETVKTLMTALRVYLDANGYSENPAIVDGLERLRCEISGVKLAGVRAALQEHLVRCKSSRGEADRSYSAN